MLSTPCLSFLISCASDWMPKIPSRWIVLDGQHRCSTRLCRHWVKVRFHHYWRRYCKSSFLSRKCCLDFAPLTIPLQHWNDQGWRHQSLRRYLKVCRGQEVWPVGTNLFLGLIHLSRLCILRIRSRLLPLPLVMHQISLDQRDQKLRLAWFWSCCEFTDLFLQLIILIAVCWWVPILGADFFVFKGLSLG